MRTRLIATVAAFVAAAAAMCVLVSSAGAAATGIWLSSAEVRGLPVSGPAYQSVLREANEPLVPQTTVGIGMTHDTSTLAVALVAARSGDPGYRRKAAEAVLSAIDSLDNRPVTEGSRALTIARNTTSYVVAADLVDLAGYNPVGDERFRTWIRRLRDYSEGVRQLQEARSNNQGTMAAAARAAISAYLGDPADLARTAQVLRGWMGDRQSYAYEHYHEGSETYMADPSQPRPVNPVGATVQGQNVDGLQPAEHSRCGPFTWPPCHTGYPWGGLGGAVVAAEILRRRGFSDIYEWESRALLRAYTRLHELSKRDSFWWERGRGDESWQPWLANYAYGTSFPAVSPSRPGNNMGWTDWTHSGRSLSDPVPGDRAFVPGDSTDLVPGDRTAPSLRSLRVRPRRLRALLRGRAIISAPQGATVSYVLSEAARVRFMVKDARSGRRVGRRCVAGRRFGQKRRCLRYVRLRGGTVHAGRPGSNRLRLSGRWRGRKLRPGRYRLIARPTDFAGNRGKAVRARFRVVRR
jgi:hypothetical protein